MDKKKMNGATIGLKQYSTLFVVVKNVTHEFIIPVVTGIAFVARQAL
jgi:hypothetical protein